MKVLNIHKRNIFTKKESVSALFSTLATDDDKMWPSEKWPKMKFRDGLKIGSSGGHGPIRYTIVDFKPESHVVFKFQKPSGFDGIHKFEITEIDSNETQIIHTIDMITSGIGTFKWIIAIQSLHNALIEDAFDRVQNRFTTEPKETKWNLWVKILRAILK